MMEEVTSRMGKVGGGRVEVYRHATGWWSGPSRLRSRNGQWRQRL